MIIVTELQNTSWGCPTQWEGRTSDGKELYARYRHGCLRVDIDGVEVFRKDVPRAADGSMDVEELAAHLNGIVKLP